MPIESRRMRVSTIPQSCWRPFLRILLVCTILLLDESSLTVDAFANGAGSCMGGMAAVGGFHLETVNSEGAERVVREGTFYDGKVTVLLDDSTMLSFEQSNGLQTQTDYKITVATAQDPGYKGILLRYSNADSSINAATQILLDPIDDTLQISDRCSTDEVNTVGLTHTSNSEKLSVSAMMRFDAPGTVQLDITIVGVNDADVSLYGYAGFVLEVTGEAVVATTAPTVAPIPLPPGVTRSPTTSPTISDFITQTLSPTYDREAVQDKENVTAPTTPTSLAKQTNPFGEMALVIGMVVSWLLFI